jgi:hypothetical protein
MTIPSEAPQDQYWYFIGLSCYDDNESYDQIGFNSWGLSSDRYWTFVISRSIWVDGEEKILVNNDVYRLDNGGTYKFRMTISNGWVYYKLYKQGWGFQWYWKKTVSKKTGGDEFVVANSVYLGYGGEIHASFTEYEEAHPGSPAPPYDWTFVATEVDGSYWYSWWELKWGSVPDDITISWWFDPFLVPYVLIDNP